MVVFENPRLRQGNFQLTKQHHAKQRSKTHCRRPCIRLTVAMGRNTPRRNGSMRKTVGINALASIKGLPGNPTEAAKKEECWLRFRNTKFDLDRAGEKAWGEHAFEVPRSDMEAVEQE